MADALVKFDEILKSLRHALAPGRILLFPVTLVECGIQLDRVELRRIIGQLILDAFRIKTLQVLAIPLCTADINFQALPLALPEHTLRVRMVFWNCKIDLFGVFDLSEFHSSAIIE